MKEKGKLYYSQVQSTLSIIGNTLLFALKLTAGMTTGSVAIIADAWHTFSDSFSSIIVIIAAKISDKPADGDHPFGHGRTELVASVIVGTLLGVIGINFVKESVVKLLHHEPVEYSTFAIIATVVSIVLKEALAQYAFYTYRKTGSKLLKADAWHHRSDSISSIVILVGIFLSPYAWWIDGVMGICVVIFIFHATYEILKESIDPLLGEKPDKELINEIKSIANTTVGYNVEAHHFHVHRYGEHTELTIHIYLDGSLNLTQSHHLCDQIENAIRERMGIETTIHCDPMEEFTEEED